MMTEKAKPVLDLVDRKAINQVATLAAKLDKPGEDAVLAALKHFDS